MNLQFVYVVKLTQFTGITDGCLNYLHNSTENYLRFQTKVVAGVAHDREISRNPQLKYFQSHRDSRLSSQNRQSVGQSVGPQTFHLIAKTTLVS